MGSHTAGLAGRPAGADGGGGGLLKRGPQAGGRALTRPPGARAATAEHENTLPSLDAVAAGVRALGPWGAEPPPAMDPQQLSTCGTSTGARAARPLRTRGQSRDRSSPGAVLLYIGMDPPQCTCTPFRTCARSWPHVGTRDDGVKRDRGRSLPSPHRRAPLRPRAASPIPAPLLPARAYRLELCRIPTLCGMPKHTLSTG